MNDYLEKLNNYFGKIYARIWVLLFVAKLNKVRNMYVYKQKLTQASWITRWYWKIKYNKANAECEKLKL